VKSQKHSVVIVEDEGLIAADLQGRLEKVGYQVPAVAGTADGALKAIREKSPDLILMDIRLQGNVDGIQVAEQVRRDFDIPVVYLTAYEDRKTLERASQTQAFGYIKKPVDCASLQGSIEMAISKHRHERYLREQRDWFSESFAALPDAVLVADAFGRTCYVNPVAEKVLGCSVADALGKPLTELLRLRDRDGRLVDDFIPAALLQGAPVAFPTDIWLEAGNGRRCTIEGSVTPRWRDGGADGVVVSFKDVTRRRFEEEQSRQDSKHDALSRLADGIAGHLDLELSVVAEESTRLLNLVPSDSSFRATAETIESAVLDALGVTSWLRAFGQDREIKPQMIQVNDVLRDLEKTWRELLSGLSVQLDPAPRAVHANSQELTRCLDMFLQHAHLSQNRRHPVTLEASAVELEGLAEWVRIRISYTSAKEDSIAVEHVFDPSWDGNWDGLPFAYGIVRRMGGLSRARMLPDKKVAFEIYLASVDVAVAGASMPDCEERVILVIDPNSEIRAVLRGYLGQHGYNVLEADSCDNALALVEQFGRPIQLALANPATDDPDRKALTARLKVFKPGICVRVAGLTTARELLDWAETALGKRILSAAG
jgi:two-component system cell cycle sensor histidine kinase/response regulator CckA